MKKKHPIEALIEQGRHQQLDFKFEVRRQQEDRPDVECVREYRWRASADWSEG